MCYEELNARINLVWEFGTLLLNGSDAVVLSLLEAGFAPFNDGNAQAQKWYVRRDATQAQAVRQWAAAWCHSRGGPWWEWRCATSGTARTG